MGALILSGLLGGVAVVALLLGARAIVATRRDQVLDRIERVTHASLRAPEPVAPSRGMEKRPWAARLLRPLSRLARPSSGAEITRIRIRLSHAGVRGPWATEIYFGSKIALGAGLAAVLLALSALRPTPVPHREIWGLVLGAIGFYAPNLWLSAGVKSRQQALTKALPDTLDLLVTCVEAGLAVESALARVTGEIGLSSPVLAQELRQTTMEIQAGVGRAASFRKLADRTGLDELKGLSAVLIQTEMFGTGIASALRIHSEAMRTRRTHRAEEKGATVAVKMMLPLILFILPSLLAVILGPAIVRIARTLLPALGGK
jgi:tight adherence protein C